ncbi:glucose 1-dehydrogenase [Virgibacillus salexigens]|uniref:3-ketoacyl-ACP reductase n=1 Tax=Virgibacillus kapii TaxID=1638645 RepID=A0ABQ2DWB2_9BACI|nr:MULTISPECIES: glucose 1-dehydrogenase [Virgibacillus]MYL40680.1 glucose 1-dehydrogenase [Virgibacillus massiliensis]GGJ72926.1 3-ketoacyl-ACP reductase [Virgibacillus kapii]
MKRLEDKIAIITGSGAGIGKQISRTYAQEGAKVVIADFDEKALQTTVNALQEQGYDALGVKVNVAEASEVQAMIDDTVEAFGRIDILVNNAGVGDNMQAAAHVEDATWERVMNVNVNGVMHTLRAIIPIFIKNGGGTIVNMASITGLTGGRGGLAYTASKHAVVGMTKNVASQYGPEHIRCNAIAPAQVETEFSARMTNVDPFGLEIATRGVNLMPKAGQVQDIANIALFLASEESAYINGVALAADAGWSAY